MPNRALPADTSLEAMRVQITVQSRLGFEGRARMAMELSENVREIARAEIRRQHPEYSEEQIRLAEIRRRLGDDLFRKAYPHVRI